MTLLHYLSEKLLGSPVDSVRFQTDLLNHLTAKKKYSDSGYLECVDYFFNDQLVVSFRYDTDYQQVFYDDQWRNLVPFGYNIFARYYKSDGSYNTELISSHLYDLKIINGVLTSIEYLDYQHRCLYRKSIIEQN